MPLLSAALGKPTGLAVGEVQALRRFSRHVTFEPNTGCWLWVGAVFAKRKSRAYGCFRAGGAGSRIVSAHRAAYELYVGPVPSGMEIDHRCQNTLCVNPSHLEPVAHWENIRRAVAVASLTPERQAFDAKRVEARALHEAGVRGVEIARRLGIHPVTVSRWLIASGNRSVPFRRRGAA